MIKLVVSYLIEFIFTSHKNQNTRAQPDWNVSPQKTQATIDKAESKKEKIDTHPINEVIAKQKIKINFVLILMGVFDRDQLSLIFSHFGKTEHLMENRSIVGRSC